MGKRLPAWRVGLSTAQLQESQPVKSHGRTPLQQHFEADLAVSHLTLALFPPTPAFKRRHQPGSE